MIMIYAAAFLLAGIGAYQAIKIIAKKVNDKFYACLCCFLLGVILMAATAAFVYWVTVGAGVVVWNGNAI